MVKQLIKPVLSQLTCILSSKLRPILIPCNDLDVSPKVYLRSNIPDSSLSSGWVLAVFPFLKSKEKLDLILEGRPPSSVKLGRTMFPSFSLLATFRKI